MRKLQVSVIFWLLALTVCGQRYGNEWINHSQEYSKFPIYKEGVYRIDSLTLSRRYNLATIDARNFQLFIRGTEQFIHIEGGQDNKINSGDYIEFYTTARMSGMDSLIYNNIKYVPNPYSPLFNDTISAFLTLNNLTTNKRYVVETDTNSAAWPAGNYVYSEKVFNFPARYNRVSEYYGFISDPNYTQSEGLGMVFGKGGAATSSFPFLNSYTNTSLPFYLTVNYSGHSRVDTVPADHHVALAYTDNNNVTQQIGDTTFKGHAPVRQSFVLNAQAINPATNFSLRSLATPTLNTIPNETMLHYLRIYYPQILNFANASLFRFDNDYTVAGKTFFNFNNFNIGTSQKVLLFDLTNGRRINTVINGGSVRAVVPNGSGRSACVMVAENSVTTVQKLNRVNNSGLYNNYNVQVTRKPFVIIYNTKLQSSALEYAAYRSSIAGGNYHVFAAPVEELYDQFAWGVSKHPVAIRNLAKFLQENLPIKPSGILLIGKGVKHEDINAGRQYSNLVPTMGIPSSDNALTAALTQSNNYAPEIPIGRIAALTNDEVIIFLRKVQEHESSGQQDWKKRVLHFVGGNDEVLSNKLSAFMQTYEQMIEDTSFGAEVITIKKNTTAPVQTSISDSIQSLINNGSALLNFFGHGHEQGFDQAIDDPELYNNKGKYPFVIANSCYSGNIHVEGRRSVSERFALANQKGSIGFLAAGSFAVDNSLNEYTHAFYRELSSTRYNQPIGDIIKQSAFATSGSPEAFTRLVGLDMTLHGDPAIVIGNGNLPDYHITNNDVIFDLKTHPDSIRITVKMVNHAKAVNDSIFVRVERGFPNGDTGVFIRKIKAPFFRDSVKFTTAVDFSRGVGLNTFKVMVDFSNRVNENNENNNSTTGTIDLIISGGDLLPVFPYKYAVIEKSASVILKASTADPFAQSSKYKFELDTNDSFKQPIAATVITSKGGVIEWKVDLPYKDSTVYYWRVSRDSTSPTKGFLWHESSFQTIGNKRGWGQSHFNQFKDNGYQFVTYKKDLRRFTFENNLYSVGARSGTWPTLTHPQFNSYFNNLILDVWSSTFNGWNFAVFDSISGQPWRANAVNTPSPGSGVYNNCASQGGRSVFSFGPLSECGVHPWKTDMENFLNAIPLNNYVLGYSTGERGPDYAGYSTYSKSLVQAFSSVGVLNVGTTPDTVGYVFFGKKGMIAGQANEVIGKNKKSVVYLSDTIESKWKNGSVVSEIIGPSYKWNSLHWQVKDLENPKGDTTVLKLVGIKSNGQADTLATFNEDSLNVNALYNYVNADTYPFLKMVAYMRDNVNRSSPQLKRWHVLYDEAPELALNPLKGFASINDSLQEGDQVTFRFPIENIGVKDFKDSLLITYWLEDAKRNKTMLPQKLKAAPFSAGQLLIDTVKINSYQLPGENTLWIFANPISNVRYQKEQTQFNNIGRFAFKVRSDVTNPLLDVTFDGVRILNGDIVSAKPDILITLKDENKFLALNDTAAFTVFLMAPGQTTRQRIFFGDQLQFTPAELPANSARIHYTPTFVVDGRYTLIVQARDRSRNSSGANDYQVQFEVNTKPSVTQVLNYPNPFSTRTKFVFTLTGSEIPEVFTIQIMTVTGKVVKEITRSELGHLHIGRNITDYTWDGRDNYGDLLANGVYLYRVVTKLNGENIEKNATAADKFFVKDFGKMVLMR